MLVASNDAQFKTASSEAIKVQTTESLGNILQFPERTKPIVVQTAEPQAPVLTSEEMGVMMYRTTFKKGMEAHLSNPSLDPKVRADGLKAMQTILAAANPSKQVFLPSIAKYEKIVKELEKDVSEMKQAIQRQKGPKVYSKSHLDAQQELAKYLKTIT